MAVGMARTETGPRRDIICGRPCCSSPMKLLRASYAWGFICFFDLRKGELRFPGLRLT